MKNIIGIILIATLISTMSYGEDKHNHKENQNVLGVEALSNDLRDLLAQEMQALQNGMMAIIPAYTSGNWGEIEIIARNMKNSYILKKSLTEKQKNELHSLLSPVFIEKDQSFHYLAGMLEHFAKNKNIELTNFYFSKMNGSCINCHSEFATHKFPKLLLTEKKDEHTY